MDDSFISAAVAARRRVEVSSWAPGPRPVHLVEEVPPGAVVVDVREPEEGPDVGDLRLPFSTLDRWIDTLDRERQYVFHCTYGVRSELVARELSARGYRALALVGGTAAIHRAA